MGQMILSSTATHPPEEDRCAGMWPGEHEVGFCPSQAQTKRSWGGSYHRNHVSGLSSCLDLPSCALTLNMGTLIYYFTFHCCLTACLALTSIPILNVLLDCFSDSKLPAKKQEKVKKRRNKLNTDAF